MKNKCPILRGLQEIDVSMKNVKSNVGVFILFMF